MKLLNQIAQAIYDKKGMNILVLDVRNVCTMTDYFIIAEGNVDRHVQALSRAVIDQMEDLGHRPFHIDGMQEGEWSVLDYGDIVVHLFIPEMREKYSLEEVWRAGKVVDVVIHTHKIGES